MLNASILIRILHDMVPDLKNLVFYYVPQAGTVVSFLIHNQNGYEVKYLSFLTCPLLLLWIYNTELSGLPGMDCNKDTLALDTFYNNHPSPCSSPKHMDDFSLVMVGHKVYYGLGHIMLEWRGKSFILHVFVLHHFVVTIFKQTFYEFLTESGNSLLNIGHNLLCWMLTGSSLTAFL